MAIFTFLFLALGLCLVNEAATQKPNILLLLADDLGIGDIGCYGNTTIRTPNIDRLAREGVKLTQHIAAASVCTPSRAAFLTGRYPIRTGMAGHANGYTVLNFNAVSGGLPTNETTFAKILKEQGYSTGIIGKWHVGLNCNSRDDFCHHPLNHGFDYFYGTPLSLMNDCEVSRPSEVHNAFKNTLWFQAQVFIITVLTLIAGKKWKLISIPWKIIGISALCVSMYFMYWIVTYAFLPYWNCVVMRNFDVVEQPMDIERSAGQIVREAKAFINRNRDRPFLLLVSFLHIHTPHYTTKEFRGRSQHDLYGDNTEEMDGMIGQILESIDQGGLINNTLTYFASDHGGYLEGMDGSPHLKGSNGIYRGGKGMGGLEGGIRVPGILRWTGVLPANTEIDKPTSLMDIYTTVAKLGGGILPQDRIIDGKDLMPLLQGRVPNSDHEFMFHYCEEYLHAVRWQQTSSDTVWKIHYISPKFSPEGAGACYTSKLCACSGEMVIYHVPPLLYNLSNDLSENHPLPIDSELYNEVLQTVQKAVADHNATLNAVPQQLYKFNNLWDPRLQPCCGIFPFCWCKEENTKL
ncbi:arylsulfatase H-like isoform 1-T6 [Anomaloglossus baeobatrachus]|uniref:arylsulfatase H-like n=1 Tax=Anomaloglossus baeobatrachus TaxID=238106 RepID=UPI003F5015DC